jgi:hypothetical protein
MNDRERLKAMITPRRDEGASWFVAHFKPPGPAVWHPLFVEFMDLRHRLNADYYPCKYFEYCLTEGFNWADADRDKKRNRPPLCDDDCGMKLIGFDSEDCEPITAGQFLDDAGPIAEANHAAWREFMARHRLDKGITRATDEMQLGIDYYNTHNDFFDFDGGTSIEEMGRPELDAAAPLPAWLVGVVTNEPAPRWGYGPIDRERARQYHEAEIERVTRLNAARGLDNEGRPLKREGAPTQ